MITVLNEQREARLHSGTASGESLWLDRAAIEEATGWSWKPEGLCHEETCVPIPRAQAGQWLRKQPGQQDGQQLDIASMWRHMGNPVSHDRAGQTWVLGTGSGQRAQSLTTLQAPDFELPDASGQMHRLSDYRGKKVLLVTWASW